MIFIEDHIICCHYGTSIDAADIVDTSADKIIGTADAAIWVTFTRKDIPTKTCNFFQSLNTQ